MTSEDWLLQATSRLHHVSIQPPQQQQPGLNQGSTIRTRVNEAISAAQPCDMLFAERHMGWQADGSQSTGEKACNCQLQVQHLSTGRQGHVAYIRPQLVLPMRLALE